MTEQLHKVLQRALALIDRDRFGSADEFIGALRGEEVKMPPSANPLRRLRRTAMLRPMGNSAAERPKAKPRVRPSPRARATVLPTWREWRS